MILKINKATQNSHLPYQEGQKVGLLGRFKVAILGKDSVLSSLYNLFSKIASCFTRESWHSEQDSDDEGENWRTNPAYDSPRAPIRKNIFAEKASLEKPSDAEIEESYEGKKAEITKRRGDLFKRAFQTILDSHGSTSRQDFAALERNGLNLIENDKDLESLKPVFAVTDYGYQQTKKAAAPEDKHPEDIFIKNLIEKYNQLRLG